LRKCIELSICSLNSSA